MTRIRSPRDITRLLNSCLIEEREKGFEAFLGRTHWLKGNSPQNLCELACTQLQLKPSDIFVHSPRMISTSILWASQSRLESDKLEMVEAAYLYIQNKGEEFPPIVVWNFYDSQRIRMVIHDGHHRVWFFHRVSGFVNAVILEPLAHYSLAENCFKQAFHIKQLAIELPVF